MPNLLVRFPLLGDDAESILLVLQGRRVSNPDTSLDLLEYLEEAFSWAPPISGKGGGGSWHPKRRDTFPKACETQLRLVGSIPEMIFSCAHRVK